MSHPHGSWQWTQTTTTDTEGTLTPVRNSTWGGPKPLRGNKKSQGDVVPEETRVVRTRAVRQAARPFRTALAVSAVERIVMRWLAEMAGYSPVADGVLMNGALLATTYERVAADRATETMRSPR